MPVLIIACAVLLGLGAALRLGTDLLAFTVRSLDMPAIPEPAWLAPAIMASWASAAVLALPAQVRCAADRSDAARPLLFAGPGALVAAVLVAMAAVVIGLHGDFPMVTVAAVRVSLDIGGAAGALPVLLLMAGLAVMAGDPQESAGALLAAPMVILAGLAATLDISIIGATITAALPMLLAAVALLPAVIVSRRLALAAWPISAALVGIFAGILFPGFLTASELVCLVLAGAIVAGAVRYAGATPAHRANWLRRAVCDLGGLVLALIALNLANFLISAIPWIIDVKRMLSGQSPSIMLAASLFGYLLLSAIAAPLTALSLVLLPIAAAYGAGVPADILVVGLAVAGLQSSVTRGIARQSADGSGSLALPARQAAWAQTLIIVIVVGLAAATTLGWL